MKSIILVLLFAAMSALVSACTIPGVGHYQRALDLGCTTSHSGLVCPNRTYRNDL